MLDDRTAAHDTDEHGATVDHGHEVLFDRAREQLLDLRVDVELLSPDRLVRYLARPVSPAFADEVASFLLRAASDRLPEQSLGAVEDRAAGIALTVVESTPLTVTLEVDRAWPAALVIGGAGVVLLAVALGLLLAARRGRTPPPAGAHSAPASAPMLPGAAAPGGASDG